MTAPNLQLHQTHASLPILNPPPTSDAADNIYRRYFVAGIVVILTAGATWGAWLLWKIGFKGDFTGISIHEVNAHGHAQIFGWVGLFIMGFAYQAFPRMWQTHLVAPRLAVAAFGMMLVGLLLRTTGLTLAGSWSLAVPTAMAGGALETAAVVIFITQLVLTFQRGGVRVHPYVGFILMGLFWFLVMTVFSVWHTFATMAAASHERLLWVVATYQAPLRDIQIHGLAMFMILGVSIRMLPTWYGAAIVPRRRGWAALILLTLSVLASVLLFVAYRWTDNHAVAALLMIPWTAMAVGVAMVALTWRLWRALPVADRTAKFIRIAYLWLGISLVMLLLLPVHQLISGISFSHAYYGAIRHAVTVGFISMMIMGVAAKVVPNLNGVDPRRLSALWGPFILINAGCLLRVGAQTLTDWHAGFFGIIGFSGTMEVAALAWWGAGLIAVIWAGRVKRETACTCCGSD